MRAALVTPSKYWIRVRGGVGVRVRVGVRGRAALSTSPSLTLA